jgi:hypothetical protein
MKLPGPFSGARALVLAAVVLSMFVVPGCGGGSSGDTPSQPEPPAQSSLHLESDAGDAMGRGLTYDYTQANARFSVQGSGPQLAVEVFAYEKWRGSIFLPQGTQRLLPGRYEVDSSGTQFGLAPLSGNAGWARSCSPQGTQGSITVQSAQYSGDTLVSLAMTLELRCVGSSSALRGSLHWRSDDPTQIAGPVNPPPGGLWAPPSGATPSTGNYVYLVSEPGDPIGNGQTMTLTSPTVVDYGRRVNIYQYQEGGSWEGNFQAMSSVSRLQQGFYGNLQGSSAIWGLNSVLGGLAWRGSTACETTDPLVDNPYRGWFVVDSVTYSGDTLQSIDLRFEQRCQGQVAALHGKIHWSTGS